MNMYLLHKNILNRRLKNNDYSFYKIAFQRRYYGARYQDPKTSRWLSTDPALSSYLPTAGGDNSQLPGMGGIYNAVNMHLYHYAGNNPVKFTDPTGMIIKDAADTLMSDAGPTAILGPEKSSELISEVGCVLTAYTRIASALAGTEIKLADANAKAAALGLFNDKNELTPEGGAKLINALVGDPNISVEFMGSLSSESTGLYAAALLDLEYNDTGENFVTGRITTENGDGTKTYDHTLNINSGSVKFDPSVEGKINILFDDTSGVRQQLKNDVRSNVLDRIDLFRVTRTGEE